MVLSEYIVKYDPSADALYIRIREGKVVESDEVGDKIIVDKARSISRN
ncbi:MAG: DUF2283 domain-containing protein [Nitrososphaeria archaeon]|nr:DUF2283 domain-containing protein [Nitrososphaeria archaeon]